MKCKAGAQEVLETIREAGFDVSLIRGYYHDDLPVTHCFTHFGPTVKPDLLKKSIAKDSKSVRGV